MGAGRPKLVDDSKVFDVAKPARSKPMGTSRSVITNYDTPIKDDTILDKQSDTERAGLPIAPSVPRRVISPINAAEEVEDNIAEPQIIEPSNITPEEKPPEEVAAPAPEVEKPALLEEKTPEPQAVETAPAPETDKAEEETPKEKPAEADGPSEELANTPDTASADATNSDSEKPKENKQKSDEEVKKEAELQELIGSKKYFIPLAHDSSKQKSRAGIWAAAVLLIIVVAGVYLAVK